MVPVRASGGALFISPRVLKRLFQKSSLRLLALLFVAPRSGSVTCACS